MHSFYERLGRVFRRVFATEHMELVERITVVLAAVGFLVHLGIVAWSRVLSPEWDFGWFSASYLSALYTPFSFLLFYEVLQLVRAIPESLSRSIAKQFDVVTLIVIRRVFKDIASIEADGIVLLAPEALTIAADMVGALALFTLATVFRRTACMSRGRSAQAADVAPFIAFKHLSALLLGVVVVVMATWSLGWWGWEMGQLAQGLPVDPKDVNAVFYEDFFGILVLVDVLVLVVSFGFTHDAHQVFRNAGYVASTVLVRLSFQGTRLESLGVLLFAVSFAIGVSIVTRFAAGVRDGDRPEATDERSDPTAPCLQEPPSGICAAS